LEAKAPALLPKFAVFDEYRMPGYERLELLYDILLANVPTFEAYIAVLLAKSAFGDKVFDKVTTVFEDQ
jgi:hypothetical protein